MLKLWRHYRAGHHISCLFGLFFLIQVALLSHTERYEHSLFISLYFGVFMTMFLLVEKTKLSALYLGLLAIGARLLLTSSQPALSQDFYRFIWDGMINAKGLNVYLHLPNDLWVSNLIEHNTFTEELYLKMGDLSASNFTNYPPFAQLCYTVIYQLSGQNIFNNILGLRILNWLAEIGSFWFLWKIFDHYKLNKKRLFLFFLNPLIILELSGNLHFEAVMLFFFMGFIYCFLVKKKLVISAVFLGLAIISKLIPLIIFPLILSYNYTPKLHKNLIEGIKVCAISSVLVIVSYLYFIDANFIQNYSSSIGLWFNKFEFNASLYYLMREIGYFLVDYNAIKVIGKLLAVTVSFGIIFISFYKPKQNNDHTFINKTGLVFLIYLIGATTVHPWYLVLPLSISIINYSKLRAITIWSATISLSYLAYNENSVSEPSLILIIEYTLVFIFIIKDIPILFSSNQASTRNSTNTKA